MQKPITSRVKRSPLLKYSPAKETKDPKAKRYGSEEGEDITTTEIKEKDSVGEYRRACGSTTDGSTKTDPKTGKAVKCAQAPKGEEPEETETVTTTKKGEDLDYDTTIMKTKKEGTILEPWEVRRQLRAQTRADRQVNKTRRKMEKYGTFDKEGKFTAKEGLSQRELRKLSQAKTGYETAGAMSSNVQKGIKSGGAAGQSYYQGQREKDKGEQDEALQLEAAKKTAKKARREEIAAQSGMSTSQAAGAIEANQTPFSGMMDTAKQLSEGADEFGNYKVGQYTTGMPMKPSAFKMKAKSPAAKKLQGAQNTLPQHLQDAIKAAPESPAKIDPMTMMMVANAVKGRSSNKMRSGFKMKGYGKK